MENKATFIGALSIIKKMRTFIDNNNLNKHKFSFGVISRITNRTKSLATYV